MKSQTTHGGLRHHIVIYSRKPNRALCDLKTGCVFPTKESKITRFPRVTLFK